MGTADADHRNSLQILSIKHGVSSLLSNLQKTDKNSCEAISRLELSVQSLEQKRSNLSSLQTDLAAFHAQLQDVMNSELDRKRGVLKSLFHPTMSRRYLSITEAHEKTFQWIFQTAALPPTDPRSQITFHRWLCSESGIYWVSGKPGSGKSTLMKYLCDHPNTTSALQQWAGADDLAVAKFFFWHAGTPMQKSLQGLLQSLVYEILSKHQARMPTLCPSRWSSVTPATEPWKQSELKKILSSLARQDTGPTKFCFFIDGFDEYDGNTFEILNCLADINCSTKIKLCLSSRPWNCFENSFGKQRTRKLYLQDLTKDDIKCYVSKTIGHTLVPSISQELIWKAQGVFLWVVLAVRSLQRGLVNGDSLKTLRERLDAFPPDLTEFFQHILNQVEDVYKNKTPCLFRVALENAEPLRLFAYSFLLQDDPKSALKIPQERISSEKFKERRILVERRLEACCKGLLEIQSGSEDDSGTFVRQVGESEDVVSLSPLAYRMAGGQTQCHEVVGFLHRTVRDFLLHEHRSWERGLPADFCPYNFTSLALIGEAKTLHENKSESPAFNSIWQERMRKLWKECVLAEDCGHLDLDIVDQIHCLIIKQDDSIKQTPNATFSVDFLRKTIQAGLVSYLKRKTSNDFINLELIGLDLLEEAFEDPFGSKNFEIIAWLLENGVAPHNDPVWATEAFYRVININVFDWGSPSHAKVLEALFVAGANTGSQSAAGLNWGKVIVQSLWTQPPERTLVTLRQLLRHAADPNRNYQYPGNETIWEGFLNCFMRLGYSSMSVCHANMIEEFLRHGADPFVSVSGHSYRFPLAVLIEQYFSYEVSRRLQDILNHEKDHQRMRSAPLGSSSTPSTKQEVLMRGERRIAPKRPHKVISDSIMSGQKEPFKRMRSGESRANPVVID